MLESVLGLLLTSHACQHVSTARRRVAVVEIQSQSPRIVFEKKNLIFCHDLCTELGEWALKEKSKIQDLISKYAIFGIHAFTL